MTSPVIGYHRNPPGITPYSPPPGNNGQMPVQTCFESLANIFRTSGFTPVFAFAASVVTFVLYGWQMAAMAVGVIAVSHLVAQRISPSEPEPYIPSLPTPPATTRLTFTAPATTITPTIISATTARAYKSSYNYSSAHNNSNNNCSYNRPRRIPHRCLPR